MSSRHLITVDDVSNEELGNIFRLAREFKKDPQSRVGVLPGTVVALLFFEPSTRTHLSFASAAQRLGFGIIGFTDPDQTSVAKGESLEDTIRVVQTFADIIVIRHPMAGSAKQAAALASLPIINGGDGANEHPTQTLYDLFTIDEIFGRIESLNVGFIGDLRYGRTVVSLSRFLSRFQNSLHFIGPEEFQITSPVEHRLHGGEAKVIKHRRLADVIGDLDILYVSRPQQERWSNGESLESLERVTPEAIDGSRPELAVMHALPRTDELSVDLDSDPRARYFHQVSNAVPVRTAVLLRSIHPE